MKRALPLLTALALAVPGTALAHPHIFAEARLEVIAGDDGTVQELRNVWRFDEVFSSSVLLDFDKNTDLKLDEAELAELGEIMRTSLADFDYFTTISVDGKDASIQKPEAFHVAYQDNQILVFFAILLRYAGTPPVRDEAGPADYIEFALVPATARPKPVVKSWEERSSSVQP
mgnify:CR=1 FL=1